MAIADDMPTTVTTSFWHPFADMGAVSQAELVIERGEGAYVFDTDGKRYLDGTASLWYANLGHGRADVTRAVAAQMDRLAAYRRSATSPTRPPTRWRRGSPRSPRWTTPRSSSPPAAATRSTPPRRSPAATGSSRASRSAMHLISRTNGYHGTHGFGTAIGGIEANTANWGPLVPQTSAVAFDSLPALEQEILRVGPERVAAFFCEPVIGAGGVFPPPEGYIEGVADLCAEHGILLVIDSVICAFGRLGTWFGIERWPEVRPDMITFAKGVTSGYLPLGGVIVDGAVAAPFFAGPGSPMLRHGATYAGHPSCAAAAMAVLDAYEAEDLIGARPRAGGAAGRRARPARRPRRRRRGPRRHRPPRRGRALGGRARRRPGRGRQGRRGRARGRRARPAAAARRRLSPPLIVDESHLAEAADAIRAGLERL